MSKTQKRGDRVQESLAATRTAVSFFAPWTAVTYWIAFTLPFSWGYLIAGVSPRQTSIYPAFGGIDAEIRPLPSFTLVRERITNVRPAIVKPGRTEAAPEHAGRKGTPEVPDYLLSVAAGEPDTARSGLSVGKPGYDLTSSKISGIRGRDLGKVEEEDAHRHDLSYFQRKDLSTRCSSFSCYADSSSEDQSRRAFAKTLVQTSSQKLRLRNGNMTGRDNRVTGPTSRHSGQHERHDPDYDPDYSEDLRHNLNRRNVEKKEYPKAFSLLHSGVQIVEELMATALTASTTLLAQQAGRGAPNYSDVSQAQPTLTPAQSAVIMHLSQPPQPQAGGLEEVEIIFICIGVVVAVVLILLLGLLLSGKKKWRL